MIMMSSGCLCCTIRGDLVSTLEDLLRRRDNNRITPFARVLIETTGLADPAPVLHTIMFHPYLMLRYRLEGVITMVDTPTSNGVITRYIGNLTVPAKPAWTGVMDTFGATTVTVVRCRE